jgi:hypothetical protein
VNLYSLVEGSNLIVYSPGILTPVEKTYNPSGEISLVKATLLLSLSNNSQLRFLLLFKSMLLL